MSNRGGRNQAGWYVRSLYRFFRWYKNVFADASVPHAWASTIFVGCHYANAIAALLLYAKLAGKNAEWTVGASSKLILIGTGVTFVYCLWFMRVLERMEAAIETDNDSAMNELSHSGIPLYAVVSIIALIGTIIYLAI